MLVFAKIVMTIITNMKEIKIKKNTIVLHCIRCGKTIDSCKCDWSWKMYQEEKKRRNKILEINNGIDTDDFYD